MVVKKNNPQETNSRPGKKIKEPNAFEKHSKRIKY